MSYYQPGILATPVPPQAGICFLHSRPLKHCRRRSTN